METRDKRYLLADFMELLAPDAPAIQYLSIEQIAESAVEVSDDTVLAAAAGEYLKFIEIFRAELERVGFEIG